MTRISIEISEQQRKKLKVLAAFYDMTIKDFILDRTIGSEPNSETIKSFNDYKNNVGLTKHDDFNDFWEDLNS
ncbi:MAG: hypothetical protein ISQ34_01200 [Rickettsiales bacterium]|nr:hypothetical protein [Rickettsiales bacterium]